MGVDSVSAYHWMLSKGFNVSPIHYNHKLRPQNDLMEEKYKELCEENNCKTIIGYGNHDPTMKFYMDEVGTVSEADCRSARLRFFNTLADYSYEDDDSPITILTAHHLNDCVESYLLNCFRGKPNHDFFSLTSDFPASEFEFSRNKGDFIIAHPFLTSRKKDFEQYAQRNNLMKFVVNDETNSVDKGSRRNWIRNKIIPEMKSQKLSLEKYCLKRIKEMTNSGNINPTTGDY